MIAVQVNGVKYFVKFRHDPPRKTYCMIEPESGSLPIIGAATVHPRDMYCKEVGRKVSLANALSFTDFNRDTRRMFWEAYFQRPGAARVTVSRDKSEVHV